MGTEEPTPTAAQVAEQVLDAAIEEYRTTYGEVSMEMTCSIAKLLAVLGPSMTTALTTFAQAQVAEALDMYGARHREDCHLEHPCEPPSYHHQFAKACPGCSCGLDARRRG